MHCRPLVLRVANDIELVLDVIGHRLRVGRAAAAATEYMRRHLSSIKINLNLLRNSSYSIRESEDYFSE